MNGSPHGPLPITGDVPDEQQARAARAALAVAARCGGTADEAWEFLGALGLREAIRSTCGPQSVATPISGVLPLADAENPREMPYGGRNGLPLSTSTTEESP